MKYVPGSGELRPELERVRQFTENPSFAVLYLDTLNAAPAVLVDGMVVKADGVNWNPGAGAGVYCYYGAAWNRLG